MGTNRQGAIIVSGGSTVQTTTASIGSQDRGSGSIYVEGRNSLFSASGDVGVGGTTIGAGGAGSITLGPSGTFATASVLRLWSGGTVTLNGGTMRFGGLASNGGRFVFNSGTIEVTANFPADATALTTILGPTRVLGTGRRIDTLTSSFNLQSDLTVSGGVIAGNSLAVTTERGSL